MSTDSPAASGDHARGVAARPRALVTLADVAYPTDSGKRLRAASIVRAMSEVAELDVVVLFADYRLGDAGPLPPDVTVERTLYLPPAPLGVARGLVRAVVGRRPWRIGAADWQFVRSRLCPWLRPSYDLVWFGALDHAVGIPDLVSGSPRIVDYDDVESIKLTAYLDRPSRREDRLERLQRSVERVWWRRLERETALSSDVVVVCSELDRGRIPVGRVDVVPNTYPDPGPAEPGSSHRPVFLMIGNYDYEPNVDAARRAAYEIRPLLLRLLPDAVIRLAGRRSAERLSDLAELPGIEIAGALDDVTKELASATAVIAPITYGGGTRTKIVEAFAHSVPVVSSTLGAEGLEATDGNEILVADTPSDFAAACALLASDQALARRMARCGRRHYLRCFRQDVAVGAVGEIVQRVLRGEP